MEEYECLLERSRRFYETALMQVERGFYDLACFSLEQSPFKLDPELLEAVDLALVLSSLSSCTLKHLFSGSA